MAKQFFYASGDTVDAVLAEAASYPRCEFSYTKLTVKEHGEATGRMAKAGSELDSGKIAAQSIEVIGRHVKTWNVTKPDGSPVDPKNADEVNRLDPALVRDMFDVICDGTEGDQEPDKRGAEEAEDEAKN